jgi:HSP20 family molecular chaperone IbpA
MARQYSNRGGLLPRGSKDLIDVIKSETGFLAEVSKERSANGLMIRARLPDSTPHTDIEIVAEGRSLHISGSRQGSEPLAESVIEVPDGYKIDSARAIYMAGSLRIFVPRE